MSHHTRMPGIELRSSIKAYTILNLCTISPAFLPFLILSFTLRLLTQTVFVTEISSAVPCSSTGQFAFRSNSELIPDHTSLLLIKHWHDLELQFCTDMVSIFETGPRCVAQASLECTLMLLPLPQNAGITTVHCHTGLFFFFKIWP